MTDDQDHGSSIEGRVDEVARDAGAALRRPAPAGGLAQVRASRRRRQAGRAVLGGSAVAVLAVGVFLVFDRDADDGGVVTGSIPATVATSTPVTVPPTAGPTTTAASTTTTAAPTTTAPGAATTGWQRTSDPLPALAYDACCGLNWDGDPSPAVPSDPAAPLPPGLYNARPAASGEASADFDDGVLTLEVRPYTRRRDVAEPSCTDPPFEPTELGVANDPARTIQVTLDDSVRVGVHGFTCQDDQLQLDVELATGADLAALATELDAAYEQAIGRPLAGGADAGELRAELAANPASGFADPGCPSYTDFAWTPPSGPGILTFLGLGGQEGAPTPEPLVSAASTFIRPTAIAVDELGGLTVYVVAGFAS